MTFAEMQGDLFSADIGSVLCHCISSDFAMGKGIAVQFTKMGVKKQLKENYPSRWDGRGYCLITETNGVTAANLITKERYFHKPTLDTLRQSLEELCNQAVERGISKIAMPKIGCGLDKLLWEDVREVIKEVFKATDLEITVYYL